MQFESDYRPAHDPTAVPGLPTAGSRPQPWTAALDESDSLTFRNPTPGGNPRWLEFDCLRGGVTQTQRAQCQAGCAERFPGTCATTCERKFNRNTNNCFTTYTCDEVLPDEPIDVGPV